MFAKEIFFKELFEHAHFVEAVSFPKAYCFGNLGVPSPSFGPIESHRDYKLAKVF